MTARPKLSEQKKEQLLESLGRLRAKFHVIDGGLSVRPDGTPAFVFVDCEKPLPPEWEGIAISQRSTKKDDVDETEVIMTLEDAGALVQRLYGTGDDQVHPDEAFRAGALLALQYTTKKKELTKDLMTKIVSVVG